MRRGRGLLFLSFLQVVGLVVVDGKVVGKLGDIGLDIDYLVVVLRVSLPLL